VPEATADLLHRAVGTRAMKSGLDGLRKASGGRLPKWSPALARPVHFVPSPRRPHGAERLVYFPSCAARNMGPQRGHDGVEMLPAVAERLLRRGGFDVVYPEALDGLCCGQPFESKGLVDAADRKSAQLAAALREASAGGRWPIVFDTSPCAYRMKKVLAGSLAIQDSIDFVHDTLLPRLTLTPQEDAIAVHPVCSVLADDIIRPMAASAMHGVTWHYSRPPIISIEYEMDLRGVGREIVLAS